MGPRNAALERNLAELKAEIERLPDHPSLNIHDDIDGKVGLYQAARKIAFIKNLLTAEMDSHSGGRPEHLNHMAMRLSLLEKTFVNWAITGRYYSILDETLVDWVALGDSDGAVNKSSDTSASCSYIESSVAGEEFVEEDSVNQEDKEFSDEEFVDENDVNQEDEEFSDGEFVDENDVNQEDNEFSASEIETNLSHVSHVTEGGRVESEEGIEEEEEDERNQEEREVGVTKDEKRGDRKRGELAREHAVEVNKDEEEEREMIQEGKVSESKVGVNDDEKVREQQQEAEKVEEREVVVKVEATEEKERWKQDGQMVGEKNLKTEEDNQGSERKEGEEIVGEKRAKETEAKERQMEGECTGEVIHDRQENRKQHSCCSVKNCMAIGCAAAAGFAIALIGVAVTNIFWVEEMVYLVPT